MVVLALCIAGAAFAATAPTANKLNLAGKGTFMGDGATAPRQGGDTIAAAAIIPALPFSDTGATGGYVNDYDEICPYSGSTSPDVVYAYTPAAAASITADLCASSYDTKIYIYAGAVGNLVACNDDAGCGYSGYQSIVENIAVSAGVTYYIVIDGYGGASETYSLAVSEYAPCVVTCPAGAQQSVEPPCSTDYFDATNGGCNSVPNVFEPMGAQADNCGNMCGLGGTYTYQGLSYRDTDWFEVTATGGALTADCTAEFPLQFILIYGPDCNNLQYNLLTGSACQTLSLSYNFGAGDTAWLWVGAQVFTGVPCSGSGSNYVLHACGIGEGQPVPVENKSWGGIKSLYR